MDSDLSSDYDIRRGLGSTNTEYNDENRSVTTIQRESSSVIDEGKGFSGEPTVSENIPSFTLR